MGARPFGAGRERDFTRADSYEPRRPLLYGQLSGDAQAWLYAHVRAHARSSQHQDHAQYGLPRDRSRDSLSRDDLHGPRRQLLRLSLRETPVSLARIQARDARQRGLSTRARRQLSERATVHAHYGVQIPDGPGAHEDEHRLRVSAIGGRPLLSRATERERGSLREVQ